MNTNDEVMKGKREGEENLQAKFEGMTLRESDKVVSTKEESVKAEKEEEEEEKKAPSNASFHRVFTDGDFIYDAKLTQSNSQNTNSKFYEMSLLEDDKKKYKLIFRWGRWGTYGMSLVYDCGSNLVQAKILFSRKFLDKTGNDWPISLGHFKKFDGMYTMIDTKRQMDGMNAERIVEDTKKEVNLFLQEQLPIWKDDTEPSGPAFVTGLPSIF